MALSFTTASASKALFGKGPKTFTPKYKDVIKPSYLLRSAASQSEGTQGRITEEERENPAASDDSGMFQSARSQLDLLEQLTSSTAGYESDSGSTGKATIREQLARLVGDRDDDFSIPLGKDLKKVSPKFLTISQKRNIKRQDYLNQVSQRNDSVFFATIGAFVILPPFFILGIAILTGYVQLFP